MRHWTTARRRFGLAAILATAFMVAWGCGRDRVNPIDPSFPGNEGLAVPGNLKATGDIGRIALAWNPITSTSLVGYGVWRSTSATGSFVRLSGEVADSLITTSRNAFVDTTVDRSLANVYFYRVNAVDNLGRSSDLSVIASAEVAEDGRPPSAPADLSAVTDVETGYVTLTWTAPQTDANNQELTGLQDFKVFRSKDTQDAFVLIGTVSAAQTTFTDSTSLEIDARYYYRVSAIDGSENESGRSTSASITTSGSGVTVPSGLRAAGAVGRVEVNWNAVTEPDLIGYLVLRSTSTQAAFVPVTSDTLFTTAQTEYIDTDVQAEQVYFYRIQAVVNDPARGVVRSTASAFVDGTASDDLSPPAAPSDLIVSLSETDVKGVELNWSAPQKDSNGDDLTGLQTYRIYRSEGNNVSFAFLAAVPATQTAYSDTSTDFLTLYYYTLSAADENENVGPRSSLVPVTTGGVTVPRGLVATAGIRQVALTWIANTEPDLIGYKVLRSDKSIGPYIELQTEESQLFTTAQTVYVDSPLVAEATLYYRLVALATGDVASDTSAFASATVLDDELAIPRNVTATGGIGEVVVRWTANTEPEWREYWVHRYSDPNSAPDSTFKGLKTTTLVDSLLGIGQVYLYQVQAIGTGGLTSELSPFVSAEVLSDTQTPAVPSVFAGELVGTTTIELTWIAPIKDANGGELTGLAKYRIYRAAGTGSAGFQLIAAVDSTLNEYRDTGLDQSSTYSYRMTAVDGHDNESSFSGSVTLTTGSSTTVSAPTNVTAVVLSGPTRVQVSWTPPAEFSSFRVERQVAGTASGDNFTVKVSSQSETTFEDTDVEAAKTYVYRVYTISSGQVSEASKVAVVAVPAE